MAQEATGAKLIDALVAKGFLDALDLTVKLIDSGEKIEWLRTELLAIKNQLCTKDITVTVIMDNYGHYGKEGPLHLR